MHFGNTIPTHMLTDTAPVFRAGPLESSSRVLHALAHPLRMRLVTFIRERGGASVQAICSELDVEQSLASQQLRILRQAGLARSEREGKHVHYLVDEERYLSVVGAVARFLDGDAVYA